MFFLQINSIIAVLLELFQAKICLKIEHDANVIDLISLMDTIFTHKILRH
jgi:hypothetical protein